MWSQKFVQLLVHSQLASDLLILLCHQQYQHSIHRHFRDIRQTLCCKFCCTLSSLKWMGHLLSSKHLRGILVVEEQHLTKPRKHCSACSLAVKNRGKVAQLETSKPSSSSIVL